MAQLVDMGGDTLIVSDIQTGASAPGQAGTSMAAGGLTTLNATATTAGGATTPALKVGTAGNGIYFGSGAPTISAAQGSLYLRTDGSSTSTRLYVNTTGSTTWTNFTSAA